MTEMLQQSKNIYTVVYIFNFGPFSEWAGHQYYIHIILDWILSVILDIVLL